MISYASLPYASMWHDKPNALREQQAVPALGCTATSAGVATDYRWQVGGRVCCFARASDTEDTILLATSRWSSHEDCFCPLPCLRHEQQLSPPCACCWERSSALLQRIASTSSYVPRVAAGYIRAGNNRLTGVGLVGCWSLLQAGVATW